MAKFIATVPEELVIIKCICAVLISSNLQFSTEVLKFGTVFFLSSSNALSFKTKMQEFLLNYSLNWPSCTFAALILLNIFL